MKILLMVTALTLASTGSVWTRTTDLPHPWLTLNRSAKVLHMQCKPPKEADNWQKVNILRLSALLPQRNESSISLVTVTSNMKEPKVDDLFTIHRVTFQGSWPTVFVSLDFLFPVTDKELGSYYCTVHYSDEDDKLSTFTTEMVVNQDLVSSHIRRQPKNAKGFSVKVIEAHEVRVTWTMPKSDKFTEASVSRMQVDEEGTPMAPSVSLFSTNGVRQFEYNSDVLLTKFNPQDSGNLSITLYVESDADSGPYRYTCRVPYPACTGHRAFFCTCCQGATNPDTPVCPFSSKDSPKFDVLFGIFLGLFLLLVIPVAIVLICFCLYKFNKTDSTCVKTFFTPRPKPADHESTELVPQKPRIDPTASSKEGSKKQHDVDTDDSEMNDGPDRTGEQISSRQKGTMQASETYSNRNSTTGEEQIPSASTTNPVESVLSNDDGSKQSRHTATVHAPPQGTSSSTPTASQKEKEKDAVTGNCKNHKTRASAPATDTHDSQRHESEGARSVGNASNGSLPPADAVRDEKRFEDPSKMSSKVGSHDIEDDSSQGAVGGSADNDLHDSHSDSDQARLLDIPNNPWPDTYYDSRPGRRQSRTVPADITD